MPKTKPQPQQKNWQKIKIGNLGKVITGKTPPTKNPEYYNGEYPFITPTDILDNSIYVKFPVRRLSEIGAEKVKSSRLPENSICYTCIASVGKIAITTEESFTNQQINSVITDSKKVDYRYIFYLLKNITPEIKGMVGGAASPIINKSAFSDIEVWVPDLLTQKQIADVLSVYDELIENNTRRIQILEELAQTIYKEWFVHFRFLGHEKVKMVDSKTEFGKIPERWEIKKVGDVFNVKYGKNLPTKNIKKTGKYPVHGAGGLIGFYDKKNSEGKVTLVTCRGNGSGTVWRTRGAGFVTNNSFMINSTERFDYLGFASIYFMLQSANVSSAISGSAQPQITIEGINFVKVVVPNKDIVKEFQTAAAPLFDLIDGLFESNKNLRQARDLLLPKLVTGEIQV